MPLKILLVYPEFPDTFWSFKHGLKFIHKRAGSPPLGLLTVAAMLPAEWPARFVDLNVTDLSQDDLQWADYVFVSAMIVQRDSARALITRCEKAGVKVVAGGPLFTMEHEQFPEVDHFVLNEAELTLPPFLKDLADGCAQRIYITAEFADVKHTPVPLWRLVNLKHYDTISLQLAPKCPSTWLTIPSCSDSWCKPDSTQSLSASRRPMKTVWSNAARPKTRTGIWWRASSGSSEPVSRCKAGSSLASTTIVPRSFNSKLISSRKAAL